MTDKKTKYPKDKRQPEPGPSLDLSCNEPLILRRLLAEALKRLRAGRAVEKDHGIVHPEVTAISRDCERLSRRLNALTNQETPSDEFSGLEL